MENTERLKLISSFYQYEGTLFWSRANSFIIANSILLVFLSNFLLAEQNDTANAVASLFLCLIGLIISVVWRKALQAGNFWLHHWLRMLKEKDAEVVSDNYLYDFNPKEKKFEEDKDKRYPKKVPARPQAFYLLNLFTLIWIVLTLFASINSFYPALFK